MIQASFYAALQAFCSQILIVQDSLEAREVLQVWRFFRPHSLAFVLPDLRVRYLDDMRAFSTELQELLAQLRLFYQAKERGQDCLLIAPLSALLHPLPQSCLLQSFSLECLESYDLSTLKEDLSRYGYEFVEVVELPGEASFRGDIVDIFIPGQELPHRLGFLGNACEDIKRFDPRTQLSQPEIIERIEIAPALFSLTKQQMLQMQARLEALKSDALIPDIASLGFWVLGDLGVDFLNTYSATLTPKALEEAQELSSLESLKSLERALKLPVLATPPKCQNLQVSLDQLHDFLELNQHRKITLLAKDQSLIPPLPKIALDVVISDCVLHFATPTQIFLSLHGYTKQRARGRSKLILDELVLGDYVVHADYGVGKFQGLVQNSVLGSVRDFLALEYGNHDRLLLPVENLHLLDRYIAPGSPTLDRLGKGSFAKLKAKLKAKLLDMATDIINLAATRNLIAGQVITPSPHALERFKHASGFALTSDQERSIAEILQDLASGKVMDRLLSGDVGFGKTEVAMHAIYALFLAGKQSAFFVPTTLLANQHFNTLKTRLEPFGVRVARLDRSSKPTEKKHILEGLKQGSLDVVVGTHALLGAEFANLGLVVVDEEHKFGVKQKEAIKLLAKSVHCLSMSATPIPRTLSMALAHIKGMSFLATPPSYKVPSRTFVKEKTPSLLKEIILRERRRGGQVFYIHNHIESMPQAKKTLTDLLPHLQIETLHAKTPLQQSQDIMQAFEQGQLDILICTSIVESGLHLPNANTIIIDRADRFGLADLHQLRGRIGRSHKEGFCYCLVENKEDLSPDALKRLVALEKNSDLGAGASLALHDLEIRGSGNFLGQDQSGHIQNIGYGLYSKMLEQAIREKSGERVELKNVDLKLAVSGYLSADLIENDSLRLELYRRLSLCSDLSSVRAIQEEIVDRFGPLDSMSAQFLQIIRVKILANLLGISKISQYAQRTTIFEGNQQYTILAPSKDDSEVLQSLLENLQERLKKLPA
ncbi:transcription-repair coupling factor [Helicobacter bizzozeronii]|uniref:transcription-repair coupling factor n=1 Tax=Helicobacter bizzozeronii TaxID=56877 RepID=UPI0018F81B50|nr:transcription-repair coupling factor [Helicobacter bizzozeronii]